MKKTLIALLALSGVACGATLSLTTPANGEVTSSNQGFVWTEDGVASTTDLTSWELSFTLTDTNALANNTFLFGTERGSTGAAGFVLKEHADGSIQLTTNGISASSDDYNVSLSAGTVSGSNVATQITLSYVATENLDGEIIGGTFTLSSATESVTLDIDTADYNANTVFEANNTGTRLWTNGGNEKFTNITLSKLDNQVVPEPATASLSLLGLAALMIRRRR